MARMYAIKRSGLHIDIDYVSHKKSAIERAVILRYSTKNPDYNADFVGFSEKEIEAERENIIKENDITHCLLLLTSIEAMIRLDADQKYCEKKKNPLSKEIKLIYDRTKGERIKLDDLIKVRIKNDNTKIKKHYDFLNKCFEYRNWLAHGRYWDPKKIPKFDFDAILLVTLNIIGETIYDFEVQP